MKNNVALILLGICIIIICTIIPLVFLTPVTHNGQERDIYISAQQWEYDPYRIIVNQGDRIRLTLASQDVVHGFFLEAHDIEAALYPGRPQFQMRHPSREKKYKPVDDVVFDVKRFGKYYYRCSVTCGTLHPFMLGELIVLPNYPFWAALGATGGILLAGFAMMFLAQKKRPPGIERSTQSWRFDLLEALPSLKWLVKRKWFQFAFCLVNFAALLLLIIAGFWGSPIGNRNISITIVWILWWFLLISFMLPFGSRIWCMMCPFPFLGEWFQRKRLLGPSDIFSDKIKKFTMQGLKKKWPGKLSNLWLQNILFLALCTLSAMLVTRPVLSSATLLTLTVIATSIHFIFRKRTFCRHVCPVGGWMSLYSMASMVEVRTKEPNVCSECKTKSGSTGNERGWGCPWSLNPSRLQRNNDCGMCMECIKTGVPDDNPCIGSCQDYSLFGPKCASCRVETPKTASYRPKLPTFPAPSPLSHAA